MNLRNVFFAFACATLAAASAHGQVAANPLARHTGDSPSALVGGAWNGADLEKRTNCTATQNNGTRGTYAEYDVTVDRNNSTLGITQIGITGLQCTYTGGYKADPDSRPTWTGHYSCTDGKTGDFTSTEILATSHAMSIRLTIKLTGSESCDIDAILGGSKF